VIGKCLRADHFGAALFADDRVIRQTRVDPPSALALSEALTRDAQIREEGFY